MRAMDQAAHLANFNELRKSLAAYSLVIDFVAAEPLWIANSDIQGRIC